MPKNEIITNEQFIEKHCRTHLKSTKYYFYLLVSIVLKIVFKNYSAKYVIYEQKNKLIN